MNIISLRERITDTDVANDVTSTRQSVITRVVIRFYDMTLSIKYQRRHIIIKFQQFKACCYALTVFLEIKECK